MLAKISQQLEILVGVVADSLNGKTNGSIGDRRFWGCLIAGDGPMPEELNKPLLTGAQRQRLYEAVTKYFLRILSQEKVLTRESLDASIPLLEMIVFKSYGTLKDLRVMLRERGVFNGFQQRLIKFTPNDSLTLTSLSLIMVHSCADQYTMDEKGYEQTFKALKWCFSMSEKLHPFLKQELSFVIVELVNKGYGNESLRSMIGQGLVKHDLLICALKGFVPDMSNINQLLIIRYISASERMLVIGRLHPKLDQIAASNPLFINFLLDRYRFVDILPIRPRQYVEQLRRVRGLIGKDACMNKFVSKTLDKLPKTFLEDLRRASTSGDCLNYICVADVFSELGRFDAYLDLASVVVKLFEDEEDLPIFLNDWNFLKRMFAVSEFRSNLLQDPNLTSEIFSRFYTIISYSCPKGFVSGDRTVIIFKVSEIKNARFLPVGIFPDANDEGTLVEDSTCILTNEDYRSSIQDGSSVGDAICVAKAGAHVDSGFVAEDAEKNDANNKAEEQLTSMSALSPAILAKQRMKSSRDRPLVDKELNSEIQRNRKHAQSSAENKPEIAESRDAGLKINEGKDDSIYLQCNTCGRTGNNLFRCGRCQDAVYCNQTCQKLDWRRGHKTTCTIITARLDEIDT